MTMFAHYDNTGHIVGFFDDGLHKDIPEPHIEISVEDWQRHIDGDVIWRVDTSGTAPKLVEFTPPPPSLAEVQSEAKRSVVNWIDTLTAQLTSKYSTVEISGFSAKKIEAEKVVAGEAGPFPLLEGELALTGETIAELAAAVLAKDAAYESITADVTGLRRNTFAAIDAATSTDEVQAALVEARTTATDMAQAKGLVVPEALGA